ESLPKNGPISRPSARKMNRVDHSRWRSENLSFEVHSCPIGEHYRIWRKRPHSWPALQTEIGVSPVHLDILMARPDSGLPRGPRSDRRSPFGVHRSAFTVHRSPFRQGNVDQRIRVSQINAFRLVVPDSEVG